MVGETLTAGNSVEMILDLFHTIPREVKSRFLASMMLLELDELEEDEDELEEKLAVCELELLPMEDDDEELKSKDELELLSGMRGIIPWFGLHFILHAHFIGFLAKSHWMTI